MLHSAIRCLTKQQLLEEDLQFADVALKEFIENSIDIYGPEDARLFGNLDNTSRHVFKCIHKHCDGPVPQDFEDFH